MVTSVPTAAGRSPACVITVLARFDFLTGGISLLVLCGRDCRAPAGVDRILPGARIKVGLDLSKRYRERYLAGTEFILVQSQIRHESCLLPVMLFDIQHFSLTKTGVQAMKLS